MPRCVPAALAALAGACLCALPVMPAPAQAQAVAARSFTAQTLRGVLVVTQPPEALLNGRPTRLAPGARLRGPDNLLLMSGAALGQPLLVHYTLDLYGQVHEAWVLSPAEAARKPWPATLQEAASWAFNPDTQTWTRP
jgi:hypothetical protein